MNKTEKTALMAASLSIYKNVLKDSASKSLFTLLCATNDKPLKFLKKWGNFIDALCSENSLHNLLGCITEQALYDENAFTRMAPTENTLEQGLCIAVLRDISVLNQMGSITPMQVLKDYKYYEDIKEIAKTLPAWETGSGMPQFTSDSPIEALINYYKANGCGMYAKYKAFVWREGKINPVVHCDSIKLDELKGYQYQRSLVVNNTKAFVDGFSANNCLLYGDKGTGKSSTVKAVVNQYYSEGLRIVEMPKERLCDFPLLVEKIAAIPMKFIIFIDDLSFQTQDTSYASLKAVLEGGLSSRPENTLIYATSNRRHLVKETFSDRDGDEIHRNDSIQESLSLSDRFGLSVNFSVPNKSGYLDIVLALAKQKGIETDEETLKLKAERWALERGGRSPRCAKQFIDSQFINK